MKAKAMVEELQETHPDVDAGSCSLTAEERETVISLTDDERDEIFIYSSQQPMIRRLLKNPLFKCKQKRFNKAYKIYPNPISVEGMLPRKALTIRTKIRKLSLEQRKQAVERLEIARERLKSHTEIENSDLK